MKKYYVVYKENQIVRGPYSYEVANTHAEDLEFALNDPNYRVLSAIELDPHPPALVAMWRFFNKPVHLRGLLHIHVH